MRPVLFIVFAAFGVFSLYAMWEVGLLGIWQAGMASVGAWQVLLDLIVMSFIALGFIVRERPDLAAGSFGPLLYLLLAPSHRARRAAPAGVSA